MPTSDNGTIYVFENMTASDASNFTNDDTLFFSATTLDPSNVIVANSGTDFDQTTLTAEGKSLVFSGLQLAGAHIEFTSSILAGTQDTVALGSAGNDSLSLGNGGANIIYGFDGDDVISAVGDKHDYIFGGGGNDNIVGSPGADHIYGYGLGAAGVADGGDTIVGDGGNDYIQGNAGDDLIVSSGRLTGIGGSYITGNMRMYGGAGNDTIIGDNGNDTINGNTGDDFIIGKMGTGLYGSATGNDSLRGGQGDDLIIGNAGGAVGNDIIDGDLGNDTLMAGRGLDVLTGGPGADVFEFYAGSAAYYETTGALANFADTITDFVHGTDHIALASNVGSGTGDVLHAQAGVVLTSMTAALAYAQQLLNGDPTNEENDGKVAALQVGADTYLFYNELGFTSVNSAIKLEGVTASTFDSTDFTTYDSHGVG